MLTLQEKVKNMISHHDSASSLEHRYIIGKQSYCMHLKALSTSYQRVSFWGINLTAALQDSLQSSFEQKNLDKFLKKLAIGVAIFTNKSFLRDYNSHFFGILDLNLSVGSTWDEFWDALREKRFLPDVSNFKAYKNKLSKSLESSASLHEEFLHLPNGGVIRMTLMAHPFGGGLVFVEDITEKQRLRREKNDVLQLFNSMVTKIDTGVVVLSAAGNVVSLNLTFAKFFFP